MHGIDIKEDYLLGLGNGILDTLLLDRTTGENIIWATDDYASMGDDYTFFKHITPELITGKNANVIQPRVAKNEKEKKRRVRKMAEVFTPSWVCNEMNNGVDHSWFKRKPVFNVAFTEEGKHLWTPTTDKVLFPEGKTWQEYVSMGVIEITCGEAPFLASRYDAVTGEAITELNRRIGWLDRKLRIVNENTTTYQEWIYWAKMAFKGILGFEWQGDNLLLARENILMSFFDYHEERFGVEPAIEDIKEISNIISWNIFQMDGLKFVIPRSCHPVVVGTHDLITGELIRQEIECEGCKKGLIHKHNGIYVKMMDWDIGQPVFFHTYNGLAKIDKL